ncbi:uncharacterized protein LOC105841361 isoform X2 [Bombyx mori]|uniref:Uncharacterized protein n=1 Tax=Bombyx mori TaxID=7091 RepID=A0A8R2DJQ0_BOMMO|nr:uncharacterized protein LOC105841361 isoform X2 [Bombyx mori]
MSHEDPKLGLQAGEKYFMVYWLCCCLWYEDKSDKTSSRHPSRAELNDAGRRRRSSEPLGRRLGSSAASLHLPTTSGGHKKALSAHRSHEDIGRRKSQCENKEDGRYHSAPSVIDEVIHRRDWERSTKELYIPLKPEPNSDLSTSPEAPHAEPESSSVECLRHEEQPKPCKKHHTNIKSSKQHNNKESTNDDVKDSDATEFADFYSADTRRDNVDQSDAGPEDVDNEATVDKSTSCTTKEVKQSLNESIRSRERPRSALAPLDENQPRVLGFNLEDVINQLDALDRSGAVHHIAESRGSGAGSALPPPAAESDLDLDLESAEEIPPAYEELQQYASPERKETAI